MDAEENSKIWDRNGLAFEFFEDEIKEVEFHDSETFIVVEAVEFGWRFVVGFYEFSDETYVFAFAFD